MDAHISELGIVYVHAKIFSIPFTMASLEVSPSIEMFLSRDSTRVQSNHGHLPPIAVVSSFDMETDNSFPEVTRNLSMHSCSSQWSTDTTQISNTTKEYSKKKHRRRKFQRFVETLMGIVKEKDEQKFRNARTIVCNWERQKSLSDVDDLSESLRSPLKDAVGPGLWLEARHRLSQASPNTRRTLNSSYDTATTESDTQTSEDMTVPMQVDDDEEDSPSRMLVGKRPYPIQRAASKGIKEMRSRKKKLWMVIRVLMQHLQKKHRHLYMKAHVLVNECKRQHKTQHRKSLSGSIEACLKKEFGPELWKRAEHCVSRAKLERREKTC